MSKTIAPIKVKGRGLAIASVILGIMSFLFFLLAWSLYAATRGHLDGAENAAQAAAGSFLAFTGGMFVVGFTGVIYPLSVLAVVFGVITATRERFKKMAIIAILAGAAASLGITVLVINIFAWT